MSIKEVVLNEYISSVFKSLGEYEDEYKELRKYFIESLGLPKQKRIPQGYLKLQMLYNGKYINVMDNSDMRDIKQWIKDHKYETFRLLLKGETWRITQK